MKLFTRSAILLTLVVAIVISSVPFGFAEIEDNVETDTIYNASALSEDTLIGILIHEIGHALGLEHTSGAIYSVMQQGLFDNEYLKNYITYFDLVKIAQLIRERGIE